MKYPGTLSLWHDLLPEPIVPRPALTGRHDFDVAIVGGGYTGLWTAYYLAKADPHLRVCVLEKEFCGFGASGRNGGWCSAHFPASLAKMAASSGRAAAVAQIRLRRSATSAWGAAAARALQRGRPACGGQRLMHGPARGQRPAGLRRISHGARAGGKLACGGARPAFAVR